MGSLLLWDASALAKRYVPEIGREVVAELFARVPLSGMVTTFLGYAETHAVLVRKRNRGEFTPAHYRTLTTALQNEVIDEEDFGVLEVEASAMLAGIALIDRHNLNSSDAAILVTFLRYAELEADAGNTCVLVAADERLIRAANAEGLVTINPQTFSAADIASFLSALL